MENDVIGKIRIEKENKEAEVTFEVIPATEWSEGHKRVDCDLARGFIPFDITGEVDEEVIKRLLGSVAHATLEEKVNFLDGEMTGLTFEEIGLPTPIGEDEEGKDEIREVETFLNCLCEDVFIENARSVKDSLMDWAIEFFGIEFVPLSDEGELDSDDDSDSDDSSIEFECISKKIVDVKIAGYVYADDLDADVTDIYFYDDCGLEAGNYVPKPHCKEGSSEFEAYYDVVEAWKVDDLFLQFLSDYSDENRTVDRGDYFLKINDGASFEFEYSDIDYEYKGMQTYVGKVHISFNGENILDLIKDEGKQAELLYDLANYYDSSVFDDKIDKRYFIFELPKSFFEDGFDEYDINSSIEEYVDVCREHLAIYLTDMLDVGSFSSTLEQEIDTNADDWDLFIMDYFTGKSEDEFKEYLVEQGYEF